jgi:hypothetical protein
MKAVIPDVCICVQHSPLTCRVSTGAPRKDFAARHTPEKPAQRLGERSSPTQPPRAEQRHSRLPQAGKGRSPDREHSSQELTIGYHQGWIEGVEFKDEG